MTARYFVTTWHGEGRTVFSIVDTARDGETVEAFATPDNTRADALERCAELNAEAAPPPRLDYVHTPPPCSCTVLTAKPSADGPTLLRIEFCPIHAHAATVAALLRSFVGAYSGPGHLLTDTQRELVEAAREVLDSMGLKA